MENRKLINDVKKRMLRENLSITNVSEITKLSRRTIQRFLTEGNASTRTIESLTAFVNKVEPYSLVSKLVNVGQVRVPQEHFDYIKRYADSNGVTMQEVFRKMVADMVDHELLWKGLNDYMEITERAVGRVLSKRIIPFIKIQDEHIKNMEIELRTTKYLAMDSVSATNEITDEEVYKLMKAYEELSINDYRDIYYSKNKEEDDELL